MSAVESPRPTPLSAGISKLESLPEGFAEQMRRQVEPGDIVGERYRVLRPIGHGAMGKVYLAENQAIGLKVAIKLLKPELLANPDFRLRFKHEAEAVAVIAHQNVARFLDLVVGDPTFLVMEYVDGPTLHQVIHKEGKLSPRRAADIGARLAWGLHAAHKAGVIHRDLKPSNILLQPDEETGEVPKIIDFGLAKLAAAPGAPLTRAGQIVGTPQYMAPEQIARKEVDARTDVYALGSVIYAMLCGRPPFTDNNDDVQLLYKQVHEPVEPVRAHAPHVAPELEAVVMRALAKAPADRYESAAELARALVPSVEKRAPRPPSEVTEVIARPRAPRSPAWWAMLATSLVLIGVAAGVYIARHAPAGGMLIVLSDPAGVDVIVDGKATGEQTPASLRGLGPGEHTVRLRHPSFDELERVVRLEDGGRAVVDVHLEPRSRTVEVSTVPPGAIVFRDGELVAGKTPLTLTLSDGEYHALRIEKAGYETATKRISPDDANQLAPFVLEVEREPRGTIFVDAGGPAAVWIDGQYSGFMTPTPGLRVSAGEHEVQLRDGGGKVLDHARVKVDKGETARISLLLEPVARTVAK
ncbi:MAG TPA: serine/threonine-protein kinase [Polyangia bacterium]|nr:serine/threonine-protein kinase [Polyangia bacterium]